MAAADVGDGRAALQLVDDPVERRQPIGDEVRVIAGAEEALAPDVDVGVVLVPAVAGPAPRGLQDLRGVVHRPERDLEEAGQERRAVLVGQRHRLLGRQRVRARARVVRHVAAGGLRVQPLPDVGLARPGAFGEPAGRAGAVGGQVAVVAELVAHHHQRRVERRPHLVHRPEHELHQLVGVDRCRRLSRGHRNLLRCRISNVGSGGSGPRPGTPLVTPEPPLDSVGADRTGARAAGHRSARLRGEDRCQRRARRHRRAGRRQDRTAAVGGGSPRRLPHPARDRHRARARDPVRRSPRRAPARAGSPGHDRPSAGACPVGGPRADGGARRRPVRHRRGHAEPAVSLRRGRARRGAAGRRPPARPPVGQCAGLRGAAAGLRPRGDARGGAGRRGRRRGRGPRPTRPRWARPRRCPRSSPTGCPRHPSPTRGSPACMR